MQVHIPTDKLFECGDCVWCGDRLDNIRYHIHSQVTNTSGILALTKTRASTKMTISYHF